MLISATALLGYVVSLILTVIVGSILDTTNDNTFYDEVIRDYYDNRILILNNEIDEK